MQPLPRKVCSEINEYKREEQRLAKQRKRMAILRNDHTCRSARLQAGCLKPRLLTRSLLKYALPSFSHCQHVPRLLTCQFKGYRDGHEAYTVNTYTQYSFMKECPWAEHLTSLPKRRGGCTHLTAEEHPCLFYKLIPSNLSPCWSWTNTGTTSL